MQSILDIAIEICRGLAACWVFLFHMPRPANGDLLVALADLGHLGVPMFFVISGFCIGGSAWSSARRGEPAASFLRRRLWRIYPPLWISMVLLTALPYLLEALSAIHTGHYNSPTPAWLDYSPADWLGIATLGRVFFSHGQELETAFNSFNTVYWTLAIEVQFYAVMALALLFRRHGDRFLLVVTLLGAGLALLPAAYCVGIFLPYWPLFAVGLTLHRLVKDGMVPANLLGRRHTTFTLAGASAVLAAFLLAAWNGWSRRMDTAHPLATFFLFGLGFAALLWLLLDLEPILRRLRHSPSAAFRAPMRLTLAIGAASYSIYLLHGKLEALPAMLIRQVLPADSLASLAITMALTVALAWLFSIVVEQRFVRHGRRPTLVAVSTPQAISPSAESALNTP